MRLLQGESEDWEVIPEPIGKWCNVQNDSEDVYQASKRQLTATRDNDKHCSVCLPAGRLSFCARVCLQDLSSSQKSGGNLLQMLYDKPSRWSYTFQVTAPDSAHSPRDKRQVKLLHFDSPVCFFLSVCLSFCLSELRMSQQNSLPTSRSLG